uniref:Sec1-like family protein n=1 Tax=Hirondellea gigas TaxID=1518452 RepID=A0A6A7G2G1_9CRUS
MATNVQEVLRRRIFDDIITPSKLSDGEFLVMVGDDTTIKVVSSCCRVHQMNEAGVGVILNVKFDREVMKVPAIYFLEPSVSSVKAMIADFADKSRPLYRRVHLYFNAPVSPDLMAMISEAKNFREHLRSFKEVYLDFHATESRVFMLNRPTTIPCLYFNEIASQERDEEITRTARQIVSLCVSLKELPYIRFYKSGKQSQVNHRIAIEVERYLQERVRNLTDWKYRDERSTLLILDRSFEPVVPLMHEYTYQAMAGDLLTIKGEKVILDDAKASDDPILLNEEDPLWVDLRHEHIGKVTQCVSKLFMDFRATNRLIDVRSKNKQDVTPKEIQEAMRSIPQYKKEMLSFHRHMSIADECLTIYKQRKLFAISQLEQDMATGLDEDQKKTKLKTIEEKLSTMIQDENISVVDKLRLVMIYIITQDGINEGTRKSLFRFAKFSLEQQQAVTNLFNLGVSLQQSCSKQNGKIYSKSDLERNAERARTVPLDLMRYLPNLEHVCESHYNGELGRERYPYVTEPPPSAAKPKRRQVGGGRSHRVRRTGRGNQQEEEGDARLIVYIAGGVTYSEIRSVYNVCKNTSNDIIIGSTSILTAKDYINDLSGPKEDDLR